MQLQRIWFGHEKRIDSSRLPAKSIGNVSIGYKKRRKTEEKVNRQCQRGSVSKRKRRTTGIGMRKRQKEMQEICLCSPIVANLYERRQTGQRKRSRLTNTDETDSLQVHEGKEGKRMHLHTNALMHVNPLKGRCVNWLHFAIQV